MLLSPSLTRLFASLLLAAAATVSALGDPIISEFMASNTNTILDVDGDSSSWIEIFNPDSTSVNLNGWYLAHKTTDLAKYKLPAVTIAPGGYLVVFASNKDRKDPTKELHTNFSLNTGDTYVALVKPDGVTVASQFLNFPPQLTDISYGVTQPTDSAPPRTGYLRIPSPKTRNQDLILLLGNVTFSRAPGLFTGAFTLTLSGAGAGQRITYVAAPPSSNNGAAVAEPTATSTTYTGPITISSSTIVRAEIFSTDNKSSSLPATAQFVPLAANAASFSSTLPVVIFDSHGSGPFIKDSTYHPAWFYVFTPPASGPTTLTGTPALATPAGMTVHGNYSSSFQKKSWGLELLDPLGQNNPQPLIGLDNNRQWELYGPFQTDRSYIRNAFVYALSNLIGRWAPRTRFVEYFVNNDSDGLTSTDYQGIGVLVDRLKISPDRIDISSLASTDVSGSAVTGGYVFKIDPTPDLTHYFFTTSHNIPTQNLAQGGTGMIIEIPDAGSLKPEQRDYAKGYIQSMENAFFAAQASNYSDRSYQDFIDVPSWIDRHMMRLFFGDVDALYHSEYFHKDRKGKLISGPVWDFDGSMGYSVGDPRNQNPSTWDTAGRDVWNYDWWGVVGHDPEIMQGWIDRWQTLRRNEFSTANLTATADSLAAQIPADAAARDATRWPDTGDGNGTTSRHGNGFLGEVAFMKDWITTRAAWIDSQWVAAPAVTTSGSNITFTPPVGAQLAYTTDGNDPRLLGGGLRTGVQLSTAALTLPATTDVVVRSYRPNFDPNTFPGSAWSSRVGGPNSSPIKNFPTITSQPVSATVASGSTVVFNAAASNSPNYHWRLNGSNVLNSNTGSNGPILVITNATAAQAGTYTVNVSNDAGIMTSTTATLAVTTTNDVGRLTNLSVLTDITATTPSFTLGTVISSGDGSTTKPLLVRAAGPSLGALGVPGTIADPKLDLLAGQTIVLANDNWGGSSTLANAMAGVGAFPYSSPTSNDAAIFATGLTPRDYTVAVSGVGGATGTVIAEIYDATPPSAFSPTTTPRLINVSVLKQVNGGGSITLGFTIGGSTAKTVLIRAIGPGLTQLGVPGVMGDPKISLFNSSSVVIAKNDDWGGDPALSLIMAHVNAFAITSNGSKDAMLLVTLPPGSYTAQATPSAGAGAAGGGLVIVEAYEVP